VASFTAAVLLAGTLLVLLGSAPLARLLDISDRRLLVVGILAIMVQATTVMPLALMQARLESAIFVGATLGISLCHLTLTVVAVAFLGWGVWGIVWALLITYAVFGFVLTLRELGRCSFVPRGRQLWQLLCFSAPLIPSGVCFFVLHSGDQFFLAKIAGASALGIYALAYRIAKGLVMFARPTARRFLAR
jgi:O-antigen/teichoic acid export membrane protein